MLFLRTAGSGDFCSIILGDEPNLKDEIPVEIVLKRGILKARSTTNFLPTRLPASSASICSVSAWWQLLARRSRLARSRCAIQRALSGVKLLLPGHNTIREIGVVPTVDLNGLAPPGTGCQPSSTGTSACHFLDACTVRVSELPALTAAHSMLPLRIAAVTFPMRTRNPQGPVVSRERSEFSSIGLDVPTKPL